MAVALSACYSWFFLFGAKQYINGSLPALLAKTITRMADHNTNLHTLACSSMEVDFWCNMVCELMTCLWILQGVQSQWAWSLAMFRTTRSQPPASSELLTWTCSPGSLGKQDWINKGRSMPGRLDTVISPSGCR